jgi:Ca-activated chloride channel family protein
MPKNQSSRRRIRCAAGGAALSVLLAAGCADKQEPAGSDVLARSTQPTITVPPDARTGAAISPPAEVASPHTIRQENFQEEKLREQKKSASNPVAPTINENAAARDDLAPAKNANEEIDGATHDQLKSLGYLGGSPPPPPSASANAYGQAAAPKPESSARVSQYSPGAPTVWIESHEPRIRIAPAPSYEPNTERYQKLEDNPVRLVANDPVSTFSLDVDTGSYSNVRRFLAGGTRPPEDAVRVEELVNYFPYEYPSSSGEHPFGVRTELAPCPWKKDHWLMRVAVRADEVNANAMPPVNLVFLVDVSGSMDDPAKLPLLRSSLKLLVPQLRARDRVSMVVYAGREAVVLEPTPGDQHAKITSAIDSLSAGGSTAGEAGIRAAYRLARQSFIKEGINRVLLATDGDFNVGVTDFEQLKDLVESERESGVQLSTLGFGTGNYNEHLMEQAADVGNGSYAYIDTLQEGRKVLVDQMRSTMVTVAKDVKVQVEFNPGVVAEYRLIGYENRVLAREDFNNDRIDAGDVGAGQSVTALYELTPVGATPSVDPLRYGAAVPESKADRPGVPPSEVAFVKLRYKEPSASVSKLVEIPVHRSAMLASFDAAGDDFRFATAVAGFGQLLRGGTRAGSWTWDDVLSIATASRGKDEFGYRSEFLNLVRMAKITS